MPIPLDFLRGILGVLCIFFAFMAGRAAMAVRLGTSKPSRLFSWILRAVLSGGVLVTRSIDIISLSVWGLAVVAFAAGFWTAGRQKPQEDLTHEMFPE